MIDLLIVGGGPIGLAAAIEARMAGLAVVVIEPREGAIDKACGEGLMPGALLALQRLSVDPDGHTLAGISYRAGGHRADHSFRHHQGRGVRRTALHSALAHRAAEMGVDVVRQKVAGIQQGGDSVSAQLTDGTVLQASWMFGCDGLHSQVREWAGLGSANRGQRRYGLSKHFAVPPWNDHVEVHWTATAELYVTPVSDNEVGVAVLGPKLTDYDNAVLSVPALAERLRNADVTAGTRGAGPLRQRTLARTAGRVLLVGDASGYVDAITGEGIRVGLAQAKAAIECLSAGTPEKYEREWKRVTRDFRMLTAGLVALGASPFRGAIVPAARALPAVYGSIVERLAR